MVSVLTRALSTTQGFIMQSSHETRLEGCVKGLPVLQIRQSRWVGCTSKGSGPGTGQVSSSGLDRVGTALASRPYLSIYNFPFTFFSFWSLSPCLPPFSSSSSLVLLLLLLTIITAAYGCLCLPHLSLTLEVQRPSLVMVPTLGCLPSTEGGAVGKRMSSRVQGLGGIYHLLTRWPGKDILSPSLIVLPRKAWRIIALRPRGCERWLN